MMVYAIRSGWFVSEEAHACDIASRKERESMSVGIPRVEVGELDGGKDRRACDGYDDDGKLDGVEPREQASLWLLHKPKSRRGKEAASLPPLQLYQHQARAQSNGASILVGHFLPRPSNYKGGKIEEEEKKPR